MFQWLRNIGDAMVEAKRQQMYGDPAPPPKRIAKNIEEWNKGPGPIIRQYFDEQDKR